MFPKIGVPQNDPKWMVYNVKPIFYIYDDLGVPLVLETPIYITQYHLPPKQVILDQIRLNFGPINYIENFGPKFWNLNLHDL